MFRPTPIFNKKNLILQQEERNGIICRKIRKKQLTESLLSYILKVS